MAESIAHRGPDDEGFWLDDQSPVALGHRRLAIVDLSPAGHQPMPSPSGRFVIAYNGEIYNHKEIWSAIKESSSPPSRRGHSDTETLLAAFDLWGVIPTLARLNGMFAFAVWDRRDRILTIARDRMGEKPLYYGRSGDALLFGSELKALQRHPSFVGELDREAMSLFLKHNYIPAPWSIWRGISKLPPASYATFDALGNCLIQPKRYWCFDEVAASGARDPLPDTPDLVDTVSKMLDNAVKMRMEADVPLGAFLSGGVDSSVVVAAMQAQSRRPVRTFSIGFHEAEFNEAQFASAVAGHLGTDHTELYVTPKDALDLIPKLPAIWDEPFSDSSQIPTLLVSQMTRKYVTVALSGDGGDELFGGYSRYVLAMRIWPQVARIPSALRPTVARFLRSPLSSRAASLVNGVLPRNKRIAAISDRLPKLAHLMDASDLLCLYDKLIGNWSAPEHIIKNGGKAELAVLRRHPDFADPREKMMFIDSCSYLPDDILAKVDRASMAVSLEARVPFLDHRMVELAWRVPMSAKIRDGKGKHVLREALYRRVPRKMIDRPKMGFGVPLDRWLSGPLRPWAEDLLDERRLREEGVFEVAPIRQAWEAHLSGTRRNHYLLWGVLMFQAWRRLNQ